MKKSVFVILSMFYLFVIVGCGTNKLEGSWQEFNTSSLGEEVVFTKNEVTVENNVLSYKVSEDKKHLILGSGGLENSVSYELSGNKLTIDNNVYYRKDSKEYKEQEEKMNKEAKKKEEKEQKEEKEKKEWTKKVDNAKTAYNKALESANKRMKEELLAKINGNWVNVIDNSKNDSTDYKKTEYSFDKEGKVTYNHQTKYGYASNVTETKEDGSGMIQFKYEGDLYLDLSDNMYSSDLSGLDEQSDDSEKKLSSITDKVKKIEKLTLDDYLEELKKKREGNTYTNDYLSIKVVDNVGDFSDTTLTLNFPESDPSILQIKGFMSFVDFKKE
ncbi:hypothetical protein UAY_02584 [Enterococcus moraviensis ATCC BAA-383]|uniref:Lipoprotein n=1 Tax=Enterococcus moraviensis ATCC BAA-383 TaxID=1158609 RepID=R2QNS3_9ENTE|nr:hypothetical protein [Enterococcus moraviensis]EOH96853.1 hypothetical protein UAY_02584 [Enterococcus moraviensis ATCC BAA-383]EOT71532.1 hypothetical protein I586_01334 [Enterococcus moraviensis ATCC BAA-383]